MKTASFILCLLTKITNSQAYAERETVNSTVRVFSADVVKKSNDISASLNSRFKNDKCQAVTSTVSAANLFPFPLNPFLGLSAIFSSNH